MRYFKNKELANIYHISEKTVRNWIENTLKGKSDLQLFQEGAKIYIANTTKNVTEIERIVEKGRKYKNSRSHREIRPKTKFYKFFTEEQIFDIIMQLDIRKEVSFHYCHVGDMQYFIDYYHRLLNESKENSLNTSKNLLEKSIPTIKDFLDKDEMINIVELGSRDGTLIHETLKNLHLSGLLRKFIGIDISTEMLSHAKNNITRWFGRNLQTEFHTRDITRHQIDDILMRNTLNKSSRKLRNIVVFLGGTVHAFLDPDQSFRVIQKSLNKNDLFIYAAKLDSERARRYFDFSPTFENYRLPTKEKLIAELLGIDDESIYNAEQFYIEEEHCRVIRIKLKISITLIFEFDKYYKEIEFNKGDAITFWRAWHSNAKERLEQLDRTGFDVLYTSRTKNNESMITISRIKQ